MEARNVTTTKNRNYESIKTENGNILFWVQDIYINGELKEVTYNKEDNREGIDFGRSRFWYKNINSYKNAIKRAKKL